MAFDYVFFLGSNPALSASECFTALSREGLSPTVRAAHERFLVLRLSRELPKHFISRLGGTVRIARVLALLDNAPDAHALAKLFSPTAERLYFGISAVAVTMSHLKGLGVAVKKLLREQNMKARFISPKSGQQLSSAQVYFNRLHIAPNKELTIFLVDAIYCVAETIQVQNIESYEQRDTGRPARDARVGMLPPKLAQMMLNVIPSFPGARPVVLDPFCGTGVVLQEGWLLGYHMHGSDISERMVDFARQNLGWLASRFSVDETLRPAISVFDATQFTGSNDSLDALVTEPFLGPPLSTSLSPEQIDARNRELHDLYLAVFRQALPLLKNGAYVVLLLPALRNGADWRLFPASLLDEVGRLGYYLNHVVPAPLQATYQTTERGTVLYARPDALVGREITLWHIRKLEDQHN